MARIFGILVLAVLACWMLRAALRVRQLALPSSAPARSHQVMVAGANDHDAFLVSWLEHEKKLITYRLLSRELRIHVTEAKQSLADFYNKRKGKSDVTATYMLIGTLAAAEQLSGNKEESQPSSSSASSSRPSLLDHRVSGRQAAADAPRQVIKLVAADNLQAARKTMNNITSCHIYSLAPGALRDPAQLAGVQYDLHTKKKYVDAWQETQRGVQLGVIANADIKDNYDPAKALPSLAAPSAPALAKRTEEQKAEQRKKDDTKQEKTERATKAAEVKTESDTKQNAGKKVGLDWSRSKPKTSEPIAAKSSKNGVATKKTAANSRKALLGSDDEAGDSEADEDVDDEEEGKPEKLGYADDDADIKAPPRGSGKRADAKVQSQSERDAQRKELEDMMDLDDATDADPAVAPAPEPVTSMMQGTDETNLPKHRVRKRRKIGTKKVRSKDARGYTVTTMESEYESYSSDDSPAVVGTKRAAPNQPAKSTSASESPAPKAEAPTPSSNAQKKPPTSSAPAKKGQQSLNSFFTRKSGGK